jgi:hypothetical protein
MLRRELFRCIDGTSGGDGWGFLLMRRRLILSVLIGYQPSIGFLLLVIL